MRRTTARTARAQARYPHVVAAALARGYDVVPTRMPDRTCQPIRRRGVSVKIHSSAALCAALAWAHCSIVPSSTKTSSSTLQQPDLQQSPSLLEATLLLEDGSAAGRAWVLLDSSVASNGVPLISRVKQADAETGLVRFERVPAGTYTLMARWQRDREDLASESLMRPSAGALPPTTRIWWGFRGGLSPTNAAHTVTMAEGSSQRFLVGSGSGDHVDEVFVRLALKTAKGFSFPRKKAEAMLTIVRYAQSVREGFELQGLVTGEWTCVLAIPSYGRTKEFSVVVPQEDVIEMTVPRFISVAGEVRCPKGVQVSDVVLTLRYEPTYLSIVEDTQTSATSASDGKFTIKNVRPGRARLEASAERGKYRFEADLDLESGKSVTGLLVDLALAK